MTVDKSHHNAILKFILLWARHAYPNPNDLSKTHVDIEVQGYTRAFWWYVVGAMLISAGFADSPLMAYHFELTHLFLSPWIPIAYAIAMGVDGAMSPILGYCYDRFGFKVLIIVTIIAAIFSLKIFVTCRDCIKFEFFT